MIVKNDVTVVVVAYYLEFLLFFSCICQRAVKFFADFKAIIISFWKVERHSMILITNDNGIPWFLAQKFKVDIYGQMWE